MATVGPPLVPKFFNIQDYEDWKEYILECKQENRVIESDKIATLAIFCIVCHKFKSDGKNYGKLYFDLLCEAVNSQEKYRSPKPQNEVRPQLFCKLPLDEVARNFLYVWPVTLSDIECDNDTKTTHYVGIPHQYQTEEVDEVHTICAIFYLAATDMVHSYRKSLRTRKESNSVELPCFLNFFKLSPMNNQNNPSSFVGEYLAFINVSFEQGFNEECKFEVFERGHDFEVHTGEKKLKFSVKSDNRRGNLKNFTEEIADLSTGATVNQVHAQNDPRIILLQNCDCRHCALTPVVKFYSTCSRFAARKIMEELFGPQECGTEHYLVSFRNYFDLRFAISSFSQQMFFGEKGFKLGQAIKEILQLASSKTNGEDDRSCLRWSWTEEA